MSADYDITKDIVRGDNPTMMDKLVTFVGPRVEFAILLILVMILIVLVANVTDTTKDIVIISGGVAIVVLSVCKVFYAMSSH